MTRAGCQVKPTCCDNQHCDPCKRSTPPPTPMLVSLHLRDGDTRQQSQSQLNDAQIVIMASPTSRRQLAKNTHLIRAIRRCALLLPRSPLALGPVSTAVNVFLVVRSPTALHLGLKTFHCIAVGIQYLYAERIRCLSKSWSVVEYCCRHRDYIICFFGPNEGCMRQKSNQGPECVMSSHEKMKQCSCYAISQGPL